MVICLVKNIKKGVIMNFKKFLNISLGFACLNMPCFADNEPEVVENEEGEPIGIKLHLPEELIKDCQNSFWSLNDVSIKDDLDDILRSPESFDEWCQKQTEIDNSNPVKLRALLRKYAYLLLGANEKNYKVDGGFCKKVKLDRILGSIHLKGATPCCCCNRSKAKDYISCLECIIEYGF